MDSEKDVIKVVVNELEKEIIRHSNSIKKVGIFLMSIFILSILYAVVFFYNYEYEIDKAVKSVRDLNKQQLFLVDQFTKKFSVRLIALSDEMANYENSKEKKQTIEDLEAIKYEVQGVRKYITALHELTLNEEVVIDSLLLNKILSTVEKANNSIDVIEVQPFQRISSLDELSIAVLWQDIDLFDSDKLIVKTSEYIEKLDFERNMHDMYMIISFFLTCIFISIALYKYHHNKICEYNNEKVRVLKLSIALKYDNGEEKTELIKFFFNKNFGEAIKTNDSINISSNTPAFQLFKKTMNERKN